GLYCRRRPHGCGRLWRLHVKVHCGSARNHGAQGRAGKEQGPCRGCRRDLLWKRNGGKPWTEPCSPGCARCRLRQIEGRWHLCQQGLRLGHEGRDAGCTVHPSWRGSRRCCCRRRKHEQRPLLHPIGPLRRQVWRAKDRRRHRGRR
ncbi:hypothetical protein LPJ56_007181, partial [Coemansia sp. RSA 2599]